MRRCLAALALVSLLAIPVHANPIDNPPPDGGGIGRGIGKGVDYIFGNPIRWVIDALEGDVYMGHGVHILFNSATGAATWAYDGD